jgi:hypothetical protein
MSEKDAGREGVGGPGFLTGSPWAETARHGEGCNCHWMPAPNPLRVADRCACMCPVHGGADALPVEQQISRKRSLK